MHRSSAGWHLGTEWLGNVLVEGLKYSQAAIYSTWVHLNYSNIADQWPPFHFFREQMRDVLLYVAPLKVWQVRNEDATNDGGHSTSAHIQLVLLREEFWKWERWSSVAWGTTHVCWRYIYAIKYSKAASPHMGGLVFQTLVPCGFLEPHIVVAQWVSCKIKNVMWWLMNLGFLFLLSNNVCFSGPESDLKYVYYMTRTCKGTQIDWRPQQDFSLVNFVKLKSVHLLPAGNIEMWDHINKKC